MLLAKRQPLSTKKENIERLFRVHPKHKFILVGDSSENDPEIYTDLQTKYPDKILQIIMHNLEKTVTEVYSVFKKILK